MMDSSRVDEMLKSFGFSDDSEENFGASEPESSPTQIKVSLKCSRCSLGFSQKPALYSHRLSCTRKKRDAPYCWPCGRRFPYKCLLSDHYSRCYVRHRRKRGNRKRFLRDIAAAVKKGEEQAAEMSKQEEKMDSGAEEHHSAVVDGDLTSDTNAIEDDDQADAASYHHEVQDMIPCPKCKKKFISIQDFKLHFQDCLGQLKLNMCRHCGMKLSLQEHHIHETLCERKIKMELLSKRKIMAQKLVERDFSGSKSSEKVFAPKMECRCCRKVFPEPSLLSKHLGKNTSCAKVHDLKLRLEHSVGALPGLKTARKSVTNRKTKNVTYDVVMSTRARSDSESAVSDEEAMNSDDSVESYLPPVGAARKTFPSPINKSKTQANPFCSICYRYFPSVNQLKQHEETHYALTDAIMNADEEISSCPQCNESFNDRYALFDHQRDFDHWGKATKSISNTSSCPICEKEFFLVSSRNSHLRNHIDRHSKEIVKFLTDTTCSICLEAFSNEAMKLQHVKLVHNEIDMTQMVLITKEPKGDKRYGKSAKDLETSTVNISMKTKRELKKHPYTCPVCFKRYSTTFIRNRHFIIHAMTSSSSFKCQLCDVELETSEDLTNHMQEKHTSIMPYECGECSLTFPTWMRAQQHCSRSHPELQVKETIIQKHGTAAFGGKESSTNQGEEFYCDVCELTFLKLCGLQRHKQSKLHLQILAKSKDKRMYSSQPTSFGLPSSNREQEIARSVTPPIINYSKRVSCSTCLLSFDDLNYFVPHRLSHFSSETGGEREINELNPYTCEICGKVMDNQQDIQLHLFWHLQDMQSQEAPAKTVSDLAVQSGLKNSKAVAKKSFCKSDASKANEKLVIGGIAKPLFTCETCSVGFTTKQNYIVHCQQHCSQVRKQKKADNSVSGGGNDKTSPNKFFACSKCFLKVDSADDLKTHEKTCTAVKTRYYCQICNCIFLQSDTYEKHKSICRAKAPAGASNNNGRPEPATVTAGTSNNKETASCPKPAREFECSQCSSSFNSMQMLYDHVKTCHDGKITGPNKAVQMSLVDDNEESDADIDDPLVGTKENGSDIPKNNAVASDTNDVAAKDTNHIPKNVTLENNIIKKNSNLIANCNIKSLTDPVVLADEDNIFAGIKDQDDLPEDSKEYADAIKELRDNFSRLLYLLVSDPDLMQRLGYGKNPIDEVVVNVLEQMGLPTIPKSDTRNELQRLRLNVRILLDVCIKDQIMELIADSQPTTDDIVATALKMFGVDEQLAAAAEMTAME